MKLLATFFASPPALSAGTAQLGRDLSLLMAGLGALVAMFAAIAAMGLLCRKHRFSFFWGFLAALFSGAAMLLCVVSASSPILIARPAGDPQETVTGFFDALIAREYDTAYAYLSGYSSLGLEGSAADEASRLMVDALKDSYSYTLYGSCAVDKLSASQEVQFRYLSLASLADDVEKETLAELNRIVEERSRAEIYDENDNYLPQIPQEAYAAALAKVLADPSGYYDTVGLQLRLEYTDGRWLLLPSDGLLTAITGGA